MGTPADPPRMNDAELRRRLKASTVAILGCGGLGSNVASMLVRSGVGALILVDFDRVEPDNINRQLYFPDEIGQLKTEALSHTLSRIDPQIRLQRADVRIDADNLRGLVAGADVIVEAVDGADTKALIMSVCMDESPGVPLVVASGLAGYASANAIVTERMAENLYVVGDLTSDVRDDRTLLASRVMVAAAHQAHAVVRVLLGHLEP